MRPSPFPDDCWLPDGVRAEIAGIPVLDGMIYVGTALPADSGGQPDPALIDPTLPVDHHHPDLRGESMDYWPSYSRISPAARAAYLQWLAA
ncbi:MAG TPA: TerB N-terminal domain-containing protein, partial [Pseudonocardiaceae bacterium]